MSCRHPIVRTHVSSSKVHHGDGPVESRSAQTCSEPYRDESQSVNRAMVNRACLIEYV